MAHLCAALTCALPPPPSPASPPPSSPLPRPSSAASPFIHFLFHPLRLHVLPPPIPVRHTRLFSTLSISSSPVIFSSLTPRSLLHFSSLLLPSLLTLIPYRSLFWSHSSAEYTSTMRRSPFSPFSDGRDVRSGSSMNAVLAQL